MSPNFSNNGGFPILPPGSNQDVTIAVVREHPDRTMELDPVDFTKLAEEGESVAPSTLAPPVFWYAGTGHLARDRFFVHGGFFSSQGSLPAISRLTPPTDINAGEVVPITFAISRVLEHDLEWRATAENRGGALLELDHGRIAAGSGVTTVGTLFRSGVATNARVVITARDVVTDFITEHSLTITVH